MFQKIPEFYRSSRFINAPPVPGAAEALQALRDVGYRLVIVTARSKSRSEQTEEWLDRWFKGECPTVIDYDICSKSQALTFVCRHL